MEPMAEFDLFRRQYIAGPRPPASQNWPSRWIGRELVLAAHVDLPVHGREETGRYLTVVGDILDPDFPERNNQQVVDWLFGELLSYLALEKAIDRLGGRWVLFAGFGDECRVYPDATGSRPIYYSFVDGQAWVSSLPSVLAREFGFDPNHRLVKEFASFKHGDWWPGALTPFNEIRHSAPNHYLDFTSGTPRRFWPKRPVASCNVEDAAPEIGRLLAGMMRAASNRHRLYMAVTGGYDSRVLIASSSDIHDKINFFTLAYPGIDDFDLKTPALLAQAFGLKYAVEEFDSPSEEFLHSFDQLASSMVRGQCRLNAASYLRFPEDALFVEGTASEIIRCFYFKKGAHPATIDAIELARRAGFEGSSPAAQAFEEWLANVPNDTNIALLDLFYWEQRVGNWNATDYQTQEWVRRVFSPFNCRQLLAIGLGTPIEARREPYQLHRNICEQMLPEVLQFRFNFSVRKSLQNYLQRLVRRTARLMIRLTGRT